jgi:hypothetical protein
MIVRELSTGGPHADPEGFLALPMEPGEVRTISCGICGTPTYIGFSGDSGAVLSVGDPAAHNRWHSRRGLLPRIRRALTWR